MSTQGSKEMPRAEIMVSTRVHHGFKVAHYCPLDKCRMKQGGRVCRKETNREKLAAVVVYGTSERIIVTEPLNPSLNNVTHAKDSGSRRLACVQRLGVVYDQRSAYAQCGVRPDTGTCPVWCTTRDQHTPSRKLLVQQPTQRLPPERDFPQPLPVGSYLVTSPIPPRNHTPAAPLLVPWVHPNVCTPPSPNPTIYTPSTLL